MTCFLFFFYNDTATTEIYTLSLHDALPISDSGIKSMTCRPFSGSSRMRAFSTTWPTPALRVSTRAALAWTSIRSEEHTSELQSRPHLVCRLLLEKKKTTSIQICCTL